VFEEHLQHLAERLARDLQRSVIIDDAALRPLAVSPQTGRLDRSRVEAVLQRGTSARLRRRLNEHGVFAAREPVPIPGDPGQAILARLCLPLRDGDQLLGFLWLIDEPALTAGQTALARDAAAQAAHLLTQRAIRADGQFALLSDLADGLLDDREQVRQQAAAVIAGQEALAGPPPWAVAVIRLADPAPGPGPGPAPGRPAAALRRAAASLRRRAAPGSLLVASPRESEIACATAAGARAGLRQAVTALPGPALAVGTWAGAAALAEVAAGLENARYAAFVAARVPSFGRSADWAGLGAYAAVQHLCPDPSAPERICPGVSALLDRHASVYRETLRCYLDCAGQAQQAAGKLHIHRTTLYWRLARAAELVPLDLNQGNDRLKLHLALTLADLTHPPAGPGGRERQSGVR
jgi:PucR-like helix-turn-helix protein/GAF domain-containing protein